MAAKKIPHFMKTIMNTNARDKRLTRLFMLLFLTHSSHERGRRPGNSRKQRKTNERNGTSNVFMGSFGTADCHGLD
ncbi:hypothetical protein L3X38_009241 [Prunus dulcis]|uniref:Uncharacterized protein n=1 Tax=Prunus dulcis TaxID=3755 RepID=A0AAD4ZYF6_PRUDU|nr:hypothetical protein L3X38_009241 [Prunus dulcis]